MAERLPEEVVAHILSFLCLSDRKSAALVARKWYHASRYPSLLRDTVAAVLFSRGAVTSVQRRWYGSLVNVSFQGVDIGPSDFFAFLTGCPLLQSLDLSCCNSLLLCGDQLFLPDPRDLERLRLTLTRLQAINLTSLRHLTDATFNKIVRMAPNLASLNLSGCPISFMSTDFSSQRSNCLLTFANIMTYVGSQSQLLHTLYFNQTNISDRALSELGEVPGLLLSGIFLDNCFEITPRGLAAFAKSQPRLQVFSLAGNNQLTAASAGSLVTSWPDLQVLDVSKCARLTADFLPALSRDPRCLVSLSLASNALLEQLLIPALGSPNLAALRVLQLGHCHGVTDEVVLALCGSARQLRVLELCSAFNITDRAVAAICANLRHLQVLDLRWCRAITDRGFLPAGVIGGDTAHSVGGGLQQLSNLRELDVSQSEVGDPFLIACPPLRDLQRLRLNNNRRVTDEGLFALMDKVPSLEELGLAMAMISDAGLCRLLPRLGRLRALNVASCDFVTDAVLSSLLQHCAGLRDLNVSFCARMSEAGVDWFEERAACVRSVNRRLVGAKA